MNRKAAWTFADRGLQQRWIHGFVALASLLVLVMGNPLWFWLFYGIVQLVLHNRADKARGLSVMDRILLAKDAQLGAEASAFQALAPRKTVLVPGWRPPAFVSAAVVLGVLLAALFAVASLEPGPSETAWRAGIAAASACALLFALFGVGHRTRVVIGSDGLRIGTQFVPYADVAGVRQRGAKVIVERNDGAEVVVRASSAERAALLMQLLSNEKRAAQRLWQQRRVPIEPINLREHASRDDWRIRLREADSLDERQRLLVRMAEADVSELRDEIADPALEGELRRELARR